MQSETKTLSDLTAKEWNSCVRLNFGRQGYMLGLMQEHRYDPEVKAALVKSGDMIMGWALLVPPRKLPIYMLYGTWARRAKYTVQVYVRKSHRGKGIGKAVMIEALKSDSNPSVIPHDEPSGALFSSFRVRTDRASRQEFFPKKKKVA